MVDLVVPTIGRPSLANLLASLGRATGPRPNRIILVDDRRDRSSALPIGRHDADLLSRITVLPGTARGPAAARNIGWRSSRARWIAFVDDDVLLTETLARRSQSRHCCLRDRCRRHHRARSRSTSGGPSDPRIGNATLPRLRARSGSRRIAPIGVPTCSQREASMSAFRVRSAKTPTSRCALLRAASASLWAPVASCIRSGLPPGGSAYVCRPETRTTC